MDYCLSFSSELTRKTAFLVGIQKSAFDMLLYIVPYLKFSIYVDEALRNRQLCVYDATRCRANTDVICEDDEFDIKNRTLPHTTYGYARALLVIPVETRLWPVRGIMYNDGSPWRRGATKVSRFGRKLFKRLPDLLRAWWRSTYKAYGNGSQVAI